MAIGCAVSKWEGACVEAGHACTLRTGRGKNWGAGFGRNSVGASCRSYEQKIPSQKWPGQHVLCASIPVQGWPLVPQLAWAAVVMIMLETAATAAPRPSCPAIWRRERSQIPLGQN